MWNSLLWPLDHSAVILGNRQRLVILYHSIINDCKILESFIEPGFKDNCEDDPYEMSSPQKILEYLKETPKMAVQFYLE